MQTNSYTQVSKRASVQLKGRWLLTIIVAVFASVAYAIVGYDF